MTEQIRTLDRNRLRGHIAECSEEAAAAVRTWLFDSLDL
ncbi:hypothetical protein [Nocardioides sp.]